MKFTSLLLIILFFSINEKLDSFPDDHRSETCTDNLFLINDKVTIKFDSTEQSNFYSPDATTRAVAIQVINSNQQTIINAINGSHNPKYAITMWGDNLTHFVGAWGYSNLLTYFNVFGGKWINVQNHGVLEISSI